MSTTSGPAEHVLAREDNDSWVVLRLVNNAKGVPATIDALGAFSCLTCQGHTVDAIICQECRTAIQVLRSGPHQQALDALLNLIIERPEFLRALEHMTDEVLASYFIDKLRRPGD